MSSRVSPSRPRSRTELGLKSAMRPSRICGDHDEGEREERQLDRDRVGVEDDLGDGALARDLRAEVALEDVPDVGDVLHQDRPVEAEFGLERGDLCLVDGLLSGQRSHGVAGQREHHQEDQQG